MKITKHKTDRAGSWAIKVDGNWTSLTIEKGDEKRWGDWQEWHLMNGDCLIMTQRRANDIIPVVGELLKALGLAAQPTNTYHNGPESGRKGEGC